MSKCLQHACECIDRHQIIYVCNTCIQHIIFVQGVTYCAHQECIGGSLTNFVKHTPYMPQLLASLANFLASYFYIFNFILCSSSSAPLDALYKRI